MRLRIALLLVSFLSCDLAFGQTKPAGGTATTLPTETTVNEFLKHTFSYEKNLEWKVLTIRPSEVPGVAFVVVAFKGEQGQQQMLRFYVAPDQKWAFVGDAIPFGADPFAPVRNDLAAKAHGPARGPEKADYTLVEFSDLQCPVCKTAQPVIDRLMKDFPNARFVFQNFPLTDLHPWAFKAASYGECVAAQSNDAFWKFVSATYDAQEQVTAENADQMLTSLAQQSGANGEAAAKCAALPATSAKVHDSMALGEALNVTGTPTLFVNGRKVQNLATIPYEVLKNLAATTTK